jgi:hypothetical protein
MLAQFRSQKQRVRDAGHAGKLQNFRAAALSLAIWCAAALFSPTSYPKARRRCDPRCMTISQPPDLTSIEME